MFSARSVFAVWLTLCEALCFFFSVGYKSELQPVKPVIVPECVAHAKIVRNSVQCETH